ncbi:MAG: hypothetical protein P1U90_13615 [Akkermansiaceae bacterium]|jgi:hypothetical protein|nr:hypothetical protein [Akkermansiaceae bacterium]
MITHQRNTYSWEFLFLAANQDAIATAAQMGISGHAAATINHDEQGTTSGSKAFSKSITVSREMNFFEDRVCEHTKASLHDNL